MQAIFNAAQDADLDDEENESSTRIWLKRGLIALVVITVLGAIAYGVSSLMSGGSTVKKQVTTIKLIPDTPPPPPPPPPKDPPKEQPKPDAPKEVKIDQPKPVETPPAEQIKMEGAAGDGPSPFAAGAVNNDYKGGDVKTIGSDGGAKFRWYKGLVKTQIEDAIEKNNQLTVGQYKLVVSIWLKANGDIEKLELAQSDANPEIERAVKQALDAMPAMREPPPENMPQPIKLRITARKMG